VGVNKGGGRGGKGGGVVKEREIIRGGIRNGSTKAIKRGWYKRDLKEFE